MDQKQSTKPMFAYADYNDMLLMFLGCLGCMADGATWPLIMLALSRITHNLAAHSSPLNIERIKQDSMILIYIAIVVGIGSFFEGLCWAWTAVRQTSQLRRQYLESILRQDVGFSDTQSEASTSAYKIISSISADTLTIQDVLAEKVPNFLMNMFMFIMSQLVATYLCWRLVLATMPLLILLIAPGIIYGKLSVKVAQVMHRAYGEAGGIIEQAISSIKTVHSYVGETQTEKRYSNALEKCSKLGIKQGILKGMAIGSVGVAFAVWSFQAWIGSRLVMRQRARGGDVFNAGVCIVMGGLALGTSLVNVKYFTEAKIAESTISEMIKRVPTVDANEDGETISDMKGQIEFKDVYFYYPSRPDNMILRKFNLKMEAYQTISLVGKSGSGKSTVISLIERFYDPNQGEVLLDEICIKMLQLKWLRDKIGLVSQEPVLFATSIKENILFGKECASMEEVISAATSANAHEFISQLPNGYDTQVGQLGSQLSGGQKQRIAIARAVLKHPKILILDEATSALDSFSEKTVLDALLQASVNRTTIIIAHRLSTIKHANLIAVLNSGQVIEQGTHSQLLELKGYYSNMVKQQNNQCKDNETATVLKDNLEKVEDDSSNSQLLTKAPNINVISDQREFDHCPSFHGLIKMASPEWKELLLGCAGAICFGAVQPIHSYCMGALLSVYYLNNHHDIEVQTKIYCFVFLSYGLLAFISNVMQHYNFSLVGESLTKRVRKSVLGNILTFETSWFDQEENNCGAICSRLTSEANILRSLICDRLSLLTQVSSASLIAVLIGLSLSWRLSSVMIALQPIIIASFYARGALMKNVSHKVLKAMSESSKLASEAAINHRTITAFSSQKKIMAMFDITLIAPQNECKNNIWFAGLGLFFSQFVTAASSGLVLWYGGYLLYHQKISYKSLFQTFFVLIATGRVIAEAGSMTSDLSKGTEAIKSMFVILKRESKISTDNRNGIKPETIIGDIEFKDVNFGYPSRSRQLVLEGFNLKIDAGKRIALVGQSGSGKSTIIGLIERFHDASGGIIEIDGVNIKEYNLRSLRSHIALISQEPTLFAGTIQDNICYGKEDATEAEVIQAATLANAHEFISCMKDGYNTKCGERGSQLSGGQKQRIAIARAILKNPSIFLMDEATSALDNNSESRVQEALDKIMDGRTCVVVAHRLCTIVKSHLIIVIQKGSVVEMGSHAELLAIGEMGAYSSLMRLQHEQNTEN